MSQMNAISKCRRAPIAVPKNLPRPGWLVSYCASPRFPSRPGHDALATVMTSKRITSNHITPPSKTKPHPSPPRRPRREHRPRPRARRRTAPRPRAPYSPRRRRGAPTLDQYKRGAADSRPRQRAAPTAAPPRQQPSGRGRSASRGTRPRLARPRRRATARDVSEAAAPRSPWTMARVLMEAKREHGGEST